MRPISAVCLACGWLSYASSRRNPKSAKHKTAAISSLSLRQTSHWQIAIIDSIALLLSERLCDIQCDRQENEE